MKRRDKGKFLEEENNREIGQKMDNMPWTSKHVEWLIDTGERLTTACGKTVEVWEFHHKNDAVVLSAWAKHFRNHYCLDDEIDKLRNGTGLTRTEYLNKIKFPDSTVKPGPSIRAGDFGEIMIADYLQYVLGYWVPRTRYADKTIRNESTKGCDIIGFKFVKKNESPKDALAIFETKAKFTGSQPQPKLQEAINDSAKDQIRKAESLNAIKQRLFDKGFQDDVKKIERFQNPKDNPYKEISGAAALLETTIFDRNQVAQTTTNTHPNADNLILIVIHGENIMTLIHELYRKAADEA